MKNKNFIPLHVHTEFSLLDGAMRLKDYIEFAKKEGWRSIAISDHGNIFGAVKFFQLAEKAGIKPILGIEAYFTPDANAPKNIENKYYHNTIFVKNEIGYHNLCRLIHFSYQKGFYFKPRIDFNILEENGEGLIILSGCIGGYVPSLLLEDKYEEAKEAALRFIKIVGKENYFIEVMPAYSEEEHKKNKLVLDLAKELDVFAVATPDSHYLLPEHHRAHDVMLSVGTKNLITDEKRFSFRDFRANLKTTSEMLSFFPDNEEVVWNTDKIGEMCDFRFKFGELFFPEFPIPKEYSEAEYFQHLCRSGLQRIFDLGVLAENEFEKYKARLELESDLIIKMGFVGYFLVVGDFIAWAKANDIPVGPGRGSGAGSVVAWALQITGIDPIKYNLLFERFLNPERVTMPDFDIDFCIFGREAVINYVKDKYGHDSVCQIITFGTMAAKGVVKDVARVLGFSFADSQVITDLIPEQIKITLKEAIKEEPLLAKMIKENEKIKDLFDLCFVLEGVTRHASKHAAGVVISPKPLKDVIPLFIPSKTTDLVTQFAMTELEAVGFLKMDFLGLKNLTVIDRVAKAVSKRYGIKINLDCLPVDDAETYKTLCQGKTSGVFQFEGSGVTDVLVKLQPDKFEDLIALNALYRPGPLGSGMVDDFIDGRHGKKEPQYFFEELRSVLEETYGVIVYQEQVMKIASVIAGFSLGSADLLRRAMGKKKPEEMEKQKTFFVEGSVARGFDREKADKLFELMAYFAGYGFNKSHSAAYALIAYQTAYLKTHYPKEFEAAILSFEINAPDKFQEYLQKSKEVGVKIFPPNINQSMLEFEATDEGVLFGLSGIKNIGTAVLDEILKIREKGKFKSFLDFGRRISLRIANKRVLESLIYSGAMDSLQGNRAQKLAKIDFLTNFVGVEKENIKTGQMGLFNSKKPAQKEVDKIEDVIFDDLPELTLTIKLEKEKEVLGFYLSCHPLDEYKTWLELLKNGKLAAVDLKTSLNKKIFSIGIKTTHKVITTKTGNKMSFIQMEDISGVNLELIAFASVHEESGGYLENENIFLFSGIVSEIKQDLVKIKLEKILPAKYISDSLKSNLDLCLNLSKEISEQRLKTTLNELKNITTSGDLKFKIYFFEQNTKLLLNAEETININLINILPNFLKKDEHFFFLKDSSPKIAQRKWGN